MCIHGPIIPDNSHTPFKMKLRHFMCVLQHDKQVLKETSVERNWEEISILCVRALCVCLCVRAGNLMWLMLLFGSSSRD